MIPLYSNSINWTLLPIPNHDGILLSSGVSRYFSIAEIKIKLISINLKKGFEQILPDVEMKLIELVKNDSLWLIKWQKNKKGYMAVTFGSEL